MSEITHLTRPGGLSATYFTFGTDHTLPGGEPGFTNYVVVIAPAKVDARGILTAWLGSNKFAFEYPESYWIHQNIDRHYQNGPAYTLVLTVAPPQQES